MGISALPSSGSLAIGLAIKGVSAAKVKVVQADLDASVAAASGSVGTASTKAVRAALDQRMAADVASGKLSQKDADAVNSTLDTMAPGSGTSPGDDGTTATAVAKPGASGSGAQPAGGGGGGGGAATKTELSRVVTVSGALETITIAYTDGSTDTETVAGGGTDTAKPQGGDKAKADPSTDIADATAYQSRIDPGSLVSKLA